MENFISKINPKIAIATFLEIVFIVIIIYLFSLATAEKPTISQINSSNFSNLIPDLPTNAQTLIQQQIYQISSENSPSNSTIDNSGATIRQDNLINIYLEPLNMHFINFTVDLPSSQSYRIVYEWSDDKNNSNILPNNPIYAMCPENNDFNCRDDYNNHGPDRIIYNIIYNYTFDGFFVIPSLSDTSLSFDIELPDDNPLTKQNSINSLKDLITKLGFDAEKYTYNAEYHNSINIYQK